MVSKRISIWSPWHQTKISFRQMAKIWNIVKRIMCSWRIIEVLEKLLIRRKSSGSWVDLHLHQTTDIHTVLLKLRKMHLIFKRILFFAGEEIVLVLSKMMLIQIKILIQIVKMELQPLKIRPALDLRECRAQTIVIGVHLRSRIGHFKGRDKSFELAAKFAVITNKP